MSIKQIIGAIILSLPFIVIFASYGYENGWKEATILFIAVIFMFGTTALGAYLLAEGG